MTWVRVKRWIASMRHRSKRQSKQKLPVIESNIQTGTMATLGKSVDRLPNMFVKDCGYIPVVLTNAAIVIEKNIKTKSLFQTQGNLSKVNSYLNRLTAPRLNKVKEDNVHDIIEAMKTFLVRLPEPLLPESVCDALITASQEQDSLSQYVTILTRFRTSSPNNFAILHFMMLLLKRISGYSEHNCMEVRKLATVFVLDIIKPLKLDDSSEQQGILLVERMQRLPYLIMVVENIINQVDIFKAVHCLKGPAASPRGSGVSMTRSINGTSPRTCISNVMVEMRPLTESHVPLNLTKVERQDGCTGLAIRCIKNAVPQKIEPLPTSRDLLVRAMSEPQKDREDAVNCCKRCVTDISVISQLSTPLDDITRNLKEFLISKKENILNTSEGSLEPGNSLSREARVIGANVKDKPYGLPRASTFGGKKRSRPSTRTAFSPTRKKSTRCERDESTHNTMGIKTQRSVDQIPTPRQDKKKRKSRSTSKKSKLEQEVNRMDSSRSTDFTIFQPDEEITPWNEGSTNSDDTSIMVKTIRNPRILAYRSSSPVISENTFCENIVPVGKDPVVSLEKVSQMLLANSWFRTISSQKMETAHPGSGHTSTSSVVSYCLNATPEVCVQCSSSEATPINKELIRGVKLNGSIAVNTSPYPNNSFTDFRRNDAEMALGQHPESATINTSMSCLKGKMSPIFNQAASSTNLNNATTRTSVPFNHMANYGVITRTHGTISGILTNCSQSQTFGTLSSNQEANSLVRGERLGGSHVRFRHQLSRKAIKSASCVQEQKTFTGVAKCGRPQRAFVGGWFMDIALVCVTLFCISLLFFFHEHNKKQHGWHT